MMLIGNLFSELKTWCNRSQKLKGQVLDGTALSRTAEWFWKSDLQSWRTAKSWRSCVAQTHYKCRDCRITLSLELTRYKNICTLSSSLKGHWQIAELQQKHKSCSNSLFHHHFSWPVVSHIWVEWRKSKLGFNLFPQNKWVFKKQSN